MPKDNIGLSWNGVAELPTEGVVARYEGGPAAVITASVADDVVVDAVAFISIGMLPTINIAFCTGCSTKFGTPNPAFASDCGTCCCMCGDTHLGGGAVVTEIAKLQKIKIFRYSTCARDCLIGMFRGGTCRTDRRHLFRWTSNCGGSI